MSRKLIHKCDGCGVEHVDDGELPGVVGILGAGRRRGTDNWGNLTVGTAGLPAVFDLCEACTKRVVDILELEIPDTSEYERRFGVAGIDHAMPFMPGNRPAPPLAGALTPEDLRKLGIEPPNLTSVPMPAPSSACSHCGINYKGAKPATCLTCGHAT